MVIRLNGRSSFNYLTIQPFNHFLLAIQHRITLFGCGYAALGCIKPLLRDWQ